ncbi:MAG: hypothetical protein LBC19_12990 [Tannerella sp.]|jgi:hypothetical protein|nr:hypothetical protein [Tannerella sp.]
MIVKPSDFQGELSIGQVEHPDIAARVQLSIDKYEPLYLRKLLGNELATLLKTEYAKEEPEQKWRDLADKIKTPCTLYIYYNYVRGNVTLSTGVGEVLSKSENAVNMPVIDKSVSAWNEMVKHNHDFLSWVESDTYPEYDRKLHCCRDSDMCRMINAFGI